jgi:hypothetical protein
MLRLGYFLPARSISFAGLAVCAVMASSTAARADFLDDLFGPSEPAARPQAPSAGNKSRSHEPARERAPRREVRTEVRVMPVARTKERDGTSQTSTVAKSDAVSASSKPVAVALCAPEATLASATPSTLLSYDKTLRNGDILVTDAGVQVFRGHAACPHDARDFLAMSSASMPRSKRNILLAIEEASKRQNGYLLTANVEKR